jgi:hypothetical protein
MGLLHATAVVDPEITVTGVPPRMRVQVKLYPFRLATAGSGALDNTATPTANTVERRTLITFIFQPPPEMSSDRIRDR